LFSFFVIPFFLLDSLTSFLKNLFLIVFNVLFVFQIKHIIIIGYKPSIRNLRLSIQVRPFWVELSFCQADIISPDSDHLAYVIYGGWSLDLQIPRVSQFLSNFLKVCILLLFVFFPLWKVLGNRETLKKPWRISLLTIHRQKKLQNFQ
jgi:hypothetical protein